ncbi:hypothetical protein [Bradyrhizobium sp. 23]|uniref:hypothetical protein n=1 Tax=Bradyrhizobium sp. 23 TaxID=2782667 RepID=UPI001FF84390|nr:hypothetical protein [Bradyrhizobium sp. 23]MCK1313383.1 hypothetical protein [Bradyrhizobium sp. 23]
MHYFPDESIGKGNSWYSVFPIPLMFLATALLYCSSTAPWGREVDPEYAYAMNGLAWAGGYSFQLFQHPGTTTLLLVGSIFKLWALIDGQTDIIGSGLKNIDSIIYAARSVEIAILTSVLFVSGLIVKRAARSSIAAMLFQVAPFVSLQTIHFPSILMPESLLVSSVILGMALILKAALGDQPPSTRLGLVLGLVCAFGMSSKFLYMPLAVVGIAALLRNRLALAVSGVVAVSAFYVIHFLFHPRVLYDGYAWLYSIASHKGQYGHGEAGLIDGDTFWLNMKAIVVAEPIIFGIFSAGAILALSRMIKSRSFLDPISITLVASFLAMCAHLLATAKHFNLHYMLANWAATSGVVVLAVIEIRRLFPRVAPQFITKAAIFFCVAICGTTIVRARNDAVEQIAQDQIGAKLSNTILSAAGSCANVTGMFVRAPEHPLSFGDIFTLATPEMVKRFSDSYVRSFKNALLDHDLYRNGLFKNFQPYSYEQLFQEYPCVVVRTFNELTSETSSGLLELKPDRCVIDRIHVYTLGISCRKLLDTYNST